MQEMLDDFRRFARVGRLKVLLYYAWMDAKYGIYRCSALTDSGRLALDAKILEWPQSMAEPETHEHGNLIKSYSLLKS